MSLFSATQSAYTHNGDMALMESLGLKVHDIARDWTDLGTVTVEEAKPDGEYGPRPATTIKCEASALPAMFYRFTITRPREDCETVDGETRGIYEPCEVLRVSTGSGSFGEYWQAAKLVAEHMLDVEVVDGLAIGEGTE